MNAEKIKNTILDKISAIPTIPHVLRRLIPILQNENAPVDDVQKVILADIAISTRLLKVANSAYYGLMRQVATVHQAIMILGMRQVKSLALGITVFETMKRIGGRQALDFRDLWLHSIGAGMAATILCEMSGGLDRDIAFTAAMLHDMGKVPLNGLFFDDYAVVIGQSEQTKSLAAAEREVLGCDHGEAGGWLCNFWKFPPNLAAPIRYHHNMGAADAASKTMTALIVAADYFSRSSGIGHGGNRYDDAVPEQALSFLRIQQTMIAQVQERVASKKEQAVSFFEAAQ